MNPLKLAAAALLIAATFPAVAVPTTDLTGLKFTQTCHELRPDEAGGWSGNQQPVNIFITNICPHHDPEEMANGPHEFKTMITRFDNKPFSLLRIDTFDYGTEINSSKGGHRVFMDGALVSPEDFVGSRYDFSGSDWTNVQWIELDYHQNGSYDHIWYVYGNMTFDSTSNEVPEPGTLGSLLIGAAGLYGFKRHRQWQRKQPNRPTMM